MKTNDDVLRNRFRGALIGLAVGDAIGTTLEFKRPGSFAAITDMVGGGPFNLSPGEWTDDTSMALCLATSLVECGGFDSRDQMERYVRWWKDGYLSSNGTCFDIGGTVRAALQRFLRDGNPYAGATDPMTAGNGSLMRLAPVALYYFRDPKEAIERAADSSRTTHGAESAVDACRYFAGLIIGALCGEPKEQLLGPYYCPISGEWTRNRLAPAIASVAAGSFTKNQPPMICGSGYVVESLEAALWAFHTTNSFQNGCLKAANLGNDADTTAAIFGTIGGASYGLDSIPSEWRARLALHDEILAMADRLFDCAVAQQ